MTVGADRLRRWRERLPCESSRLYRERLPRESSRLGASVESAANIPLVA
jgi:hypothetical protein